MNIRCRFLFLSFLLFIFPYTSAKEPEHFIVEYPGHENVPHLRASGIFSEQTKAHELIEKLSSNEELHSSHLHIIEQVMKTVPVTLQCELHEASVAKMVANTDTKIIKPGEILVAHFKKEEHRVERVAHLEYGTPTLYVVHKEAALPETRENKPQNTGVQANQPHESGDNIVQTTGEKGKKLAEGGTLSFGVAYRVEDTEINITGHKVDAKSELKVWDVLHEIHFGVLDTEIKREIEDAEKMEVAEEKQKAKQAAKARLHAHKLNELTPEMKQHIAALKKHFAVTHANSKLHFVKPDGTLSDALGKHKLIREIIQEHAGDSFELNGVTYSGIKFVVLENKKPNDPNTPHNPHAVSHVEAAQGAQAVEAAKGGVKAVQQDELNDA